MRKSRNTGDLLPVRVAAELREEILRREDGVYLGSEDELVARYGVSNPTFRQTARLLEQEQLLTVRRGPGGGYYGRRPDVNQVSRSAATFLRAQSVSVEQVFQSTKAAVEMIARAAAASTNEKGRSRLADVRAELAATDVSDFDVAQMMQMEEMFRVAVVALAKDPISDLLLSMLRHVAYENVRELLPRRRTELRFKFRQLCLLVADAILAAEPDVAAGAYARLIDLSYEGIARMITEGGASS